MARGDAPAAAACEDEACVLKMQPRNDDGLEPRVVIGEVDDGEERRQAPTPMLMSMMTERRLAVRARPLHAAYIGISLPLGALRIVPMRNDNTFLGPASTKTAPNIGAPTLETRNCLRICTGVTGGSSYRIRNVRYVSHKSCYEFRITHKTCECFTISQRTWVIYGRKTCELLLMSAQVVAAFADGIARRGAFMKPRISVKLLFKGATNNKHASSSQIKIIGHETCPVHPMMIRSSDAVNL
ncbi:uncharacterized protein LAESUDRAFT_712461 [Laetiporus sulphureus 93-53]|uniref:Uncharacterized protein n=1 Tax=Laetiporus sulphureus 93-53 TaxID=1314785 RepID=A0A165FTK2_9APHY|nr:uncharacterized protein LAESUDRAFT_712461 [Laetiporus sulphureus 93-53]KZT09392.1 hypothetical protein LAESUDRAFT_712461 [Laetiporus sulphureus 93-53]